jgi:uncharacterized protein with HEPN domain
VKDDRVYVAHILRCILRIEEYTVDGRDRFFSSHLIQDGVLRNLESMYRAISEDMPKLKAACETMLQVLPKAE